MSNEAQNLVKSRKFGSVTRKAVALVLADYCDASWSCFVGQERLAWEAEVGERTCRRVLAELELEGLIVRHARHRDDGRGRTSDRTVLVTWAIEALPQRPTGQRGRLKEA